MTQPPVLPSAPQIGRTYELMLPYVRPLLTKNGLRTMHHMTLYKIQQQIIEDTRRLARSSRVPTLQRGEVELAYYPGNNRTQDSDGIMPTLSAALDGLVKHGVFADDGARYVLLTATRVVLRSQDPYNLTHPRLVLTIRERLD